ncbi:hypothetical protein [Helicobacter sp. 23-1045]
MAESLAKKCQIHKSKLHQSKRHRQIHTRQNEMLINILKGKTQEITTPQTTQNLYLSPSPCGRGLGWGIYRKGENFERFFAHFIRSK